MLTQNELMMIVLAAPMLIAGFVLTVEMFNMIVGTDLRHERRNYKERVNL